METAKRRWVPYVFLSPYLLFYAAFGLFPILFSFYVSLTSWDGIKEKTFVGLDNYLHLFNPGSYFFKSIGNTLLFVGIALPLQIFLGLVIATLLYSKFVKGRAFFQLVNFMPYIVTPVAIGLMFNLMFDWQVGIVNKLLLHFGIIDEAIYWLGETTYARMVVILMLVWKGFGYTMIFYLAGLANISKDLLEAAQVDGANAVRTFFSITLPLLRPVTMFIFITGIIGGFQLLEEPMLLFTGSNMGSIGIIGGPDRCCLTAVWNMYDTAFGSTTRYGLGAAIAWGTCLIIALFSFFGVKLYKGDPE
mgnify:CR=1 FL=1